MAATLFLTALLAVIVAVALRTAMLALSAFAPSNVSTLLGKPSPAMPRQSPPDEC
jgi:hypothetical protein